MWKGLAEEKKAFQRKIFLKRLLRGKKLFPIFFLPFPQIIYGRPPIFLSKTVKLISCLLPTWSIHSFPVDKPPWSRCRFSAGYTGPRGPTRAPASPVHYLYMLTLLSRWTRKRNFTLDWPALDSHGCSFHVGHMQARFWSCRFSIGLVLVSCRPMWAGQRSTNAAPLCKPTLKPIWLATANPRRPHAGQPPWPALYPRITDTGLSIGLDSMLPVTIVFFFCLPYLDSSPRWSALLIFTSYTLV